MSTTTVRRAGRALAEVAFGPHGLDRYAELVDPLWSRDDLRARVVDVRHQTPTSVTLTLRPNHWNGFVAGQHTALTVTVDGVRHTRCYSITGSQHDRRPTIELTIKAHPGGLVSPHLVARAAVGDVVDLTPASGSFVLPLTRPDHLLLVSGGSGITPVLSMLRTLCDEGHRGDVTFLHYALRADDLLYTAELDRLAARHPNVRVLRVLTDEPGRGDLDGFLTVDQLEHVDPRWADADTFVCGPAPLMDAARHAYAAVGREERVRTESFTLTSLAPSPTAGERGTLRFSTSSLEVVDDGRPVLAQAEDAGLTPRSGCRMGICHTCTRTLRGGAVRDLVTGAVHEGPDTRVRICVSAPLGDAEIDL